MMNLSSPSRRSASSSLVAVIIAALSLGLAGTAQAAPGDKKSRDKAALELATGLAVMQAPSVMDGDFFSIEAAPELTGAIPVAAGMHRLWDMKTAWRDVNPAPGVFDWSVLDQRIAQTEASGARPLLVLGLTPAWAATDPSDGDPRWGLGSASPPADVNNWRTYVNAVVDRYGARIAAYEVWNEANLATFWKGTPDQMAELTDIAYQVVKAKVPNAKVMTASTTTRLRVPMTRFTQAYLTGLKSRNYPFDGFTIHTYPAGNAGPNARYADIVAWQTAVVNTVGSKSDVLVRPVWDTEVNFGLAGPGATPPQDYDDQQGAGLLSRAYVDSARLGIDATFWYLVTAAPFDLLGVQFVANGTPITANSWNVTRGQLLGVSLRGCGSTTGQPGGAVMCVLDREGDTQDRIVFSEAGGPIATPDLRYRTIQTPFAAGRSRCAETTCYLKAAQPYPVFLTGVR